VEGRKLKDMFGSRAKPQAEESRATMSPTGPVTETSSQARGAAPARRAKTLEAKEVNLYYGDFHAVEGVNMTIEPNKVTALIGSSGCGKTTFLRSLNRMHELTPGASVKGDIALDGEDIYANGIDPVAVRRLIGMVFQQPNPFPTMSIYDNVAAGLNFNSGRVSKSDKDAVVEKSLRGAHLWDEVKDRLDKPGSSLSGGQQQRLCIARATAVSPEVLLMDEPCSALDPVATLAIEDLIAELKKEYTIAIVTHNMQQASRASDITAFFNLDESGKPGHLVEIGPTDEIFTKPKQKETEDYVSGRFG
jgi:phosphate transport system ATP-binding protein